MNKSSYGSNDGSQGSGGRGHSEDITQYLLKTEQQILQLISARAPIAKILNEICYALDCQIGNMVSVVLLPGEDSIGAAEIAKNAVLFGLHVFFATDIAADSGHQLGTLEMYSTDSRRPSPVELQWIARAVCLAAIAVACRVKIMDDEGSLAQGDRIIRSFVAERPATTN